MDNESIYEAWCRALKKHEKKSDVLKALSAEQGVPQYQIKTLLMERGIWEKGVLRQFGYDWRKIADPAQKEQLYLSWSAQLKAGAKKQEALRAAAKNAGFTQKKSRDILEDRGLWDVEEFAKTGFDHSEVPKSALVRQKQRELSAMSQTIPDEDEDDHKSNREFNISCGCLVLGVILLFFMIYGKEFFREGNPFPRGDGWYCTDRGGTNCYLDP